MTRPPPQEWHVAEICLLPKPSKPLKGPDTLRPISLLHPVSKCLATALNGRLQSCLHTAVSRQPQFAYVAGRAAQDAIDRALMHCQHVRSLLQAQRQTIHLRKQDHHPTEISGGVTLSLNLQKAFDLLPRDKLLAALEAAQAEPSLVWTILKLRDWASMRFQLGQQEECVGTSNGVRQGCGLAPSLWVVYTCLILQAFQTRIPANCLTAYADDLLVQWTVRTVQQFEQVCRDIQFILATLEQFGMRISKEKTVVLLGLRGTAATSLLKRHTCVDPKRGRLFRVPQLPGDATPQVLLPIVKQHTYLGIRISYQHYEKATLGLRLQQSWSAFHRLLPILRSRSLSSRQRLQVWVACPFASLLYGLDCLQLSSAELDRFRKQAIRQLRTLYKAPVFTTRDNAQVFLDKYGIKDPLLTLLERTVNRVSQRQRGPQSPLWADQVRKRWVGLCQHASDMLRF